MEKVRLGDIGDIITGNTPKTDDERNYESNDIPFVKPSDIKTDNITEIRSTEFYISEYARRKARLIPKESILVTCIGIVGKVAISQCECAFNQQINAIIPYGKKVNARYLAYALSSMPAMMQDKANAAVVPILNKSQFSDLKIQLPKLTKQEAIVFILDKLTDLINKRKQQLQKLDELVKARFVEMFGDPEINNKKFDVVLGEKIFKLSNGKFVPEDERRNSGIPVYGGNGISWYTEDILYEKDTIVVGRVGYQSGNVHLVRGPVWISDNAMYISDLYDNEFELPFLYALMEQIDFTRYQDAGDLKKITQKPFMKMRYIRPPKELQIKYISFVNEVSILKTVIKNSLDKLELLKKALMQEYFG